MGRKDLSHALNRGIEKMGTADQVLRICESRLEKFSLFNAATALQKVAVSPDAQSVRSGRRFRELLDQTQRLLVDDQGQVQPKTLAIIASALARLAESHTMLIDSVSDCTVQVIGAFNAQDLSNTVWAYATLGVAKPELLDAVSVRALEILGDFNAQ